MDSGNTFFEMISELINSHSFDEPPPGFQAQIRTRYASEIYLLLRSSTAENIETELPCTVASAVYGICITEDELGNSEQMLAKILPILDELSLISEIMAIEYKPWESRARESQQSLYKKRCGSEWDSFDGSQQTELLRYVGFALFREPSEEPSPSNKETGYPSNQLEEIEKMCRVIKDKNRHESWKLKYDKMVSDLVREHVFEDTTSARQRITRKYQISEICKLFYEDNLNEDEMELKLHTHLASAVYGTPITEDTLFNSSASVQMLSKISPIFEKLSLIREEYPKRNSTLLAVSFMVLKVELEKKFHCVHEPVFRVPDDSGVVSNIRFIDRNLRVYDGWDHFLQSNKLPRGSYCYPVAGTYSGDVSGNVLVEFGESPAGNTVQKVLDAGDKLGTVVGVGSCIVGVASLIPAITVAAPLLVGATISSVVIGAYGVGRGVGNIVDMSQHEQDIGLENAEARNTYISMAGSSLNILAMGASMSTVRLASQGRVLGPAGRFGVNALQISSLTANGIGIFATGVHLYRKTRDGNVTTLEMFQFSSSLLFFGMSLHNYRSASSIIEETQQAKLTDYRANLRSNRHRKAFDRTSRATRQGQNTIDGNAKVIRRINNISQTDEYFAGVARINKHHKRSEAKMAFSEAPGKVLINDAVNVDPSSFANLNKADRVQVLEASRNLDNGSLTRAGFEQLLSNVATGYGVAFDSDIFIRELTVYRAFEGNSLNEIDVSGYLSQLSQSALQFALKKMENVMKDPRTGIAMIKVTFKLAKKLGALVMAEERHLFLDFCFDFILDVVGRLEDAYQTARKLVCNQANFNSSHFDREYGINGNRSEHFIVLVGQIYSIGQKFARFRMEYAAFRARHAASSRR